MAEALLDAVLGSLGKDGAPAYEIITRMTGAELEGLEYEPLFACTGAEAARQKKKAHFVTADGYVTMSDGTGIVHIAPAFGEDDSRVGRNYDLPFVQFVDGKGEMTAETPYAGKFVKDADPLVLVDLDKEGKLFSAPKFEHDYPHCWRCNTPLIYYARESWFIRMTAVKEQLLRNNATVNWIPENVGKGRFGDWLENIQDWGLSRNRYWGTPLNIWECSCGKTHAIGSIEELRAMSDNCPEDIELHRPYIDAVTLRCPDCGGEMRRVPEVIDCWFDSGAMPFAQWHYPFENKEIFDAHFPADWISEGVDQTRGWFYSLMAISTLIFDKAPYKNVLVLGHVLDKDGQKMSKSKGNAVDPFEALEEFGADAIRWYFYSNSAPWLPNRFYREAVVEGQRRFMGTLWNTYAFFTLYAGIDGYDPKRHVLDEGALTVMDKWLLSRLHTMVGGVDKNLEAYAIPEATRLLDDFVDELSNWYVRCNRERFWGKEMTADKIAAYSTLYTALVTTVKAVAPLLPFMAENMYQNLVAEQDASAPRSVHLCSYPVSDASRIDAELEARMKEVLAVTVLGRSARNAASVKNRQPIGRMFVKADEALPAFFCDIIKDELNVKEIVFTDDLSRFTTYTFKPQLRTVGPKYGKILGGIRAALDTLDGNAAMAELEESGVLKITVGDTVAELTKDDLLIDAVKMPGFETASDRGVTVVLDVTLTPELIEEGYVNELVSKIQTMRKENGFDVTDHIYVTLAASEKLTAVAKANEGKIAAVVLADGFIYADAQIVGGKEWAINDEKATLFLKKA